MTPEGTYTYNELIGTIRARLKLFDQEKYAKKTLFNDIYRAICELAELSGAKNDPRYRLSQIIPVTKSVVSDGGSAGVTYTKATKTLLVPLNATNGDNVWTGDTDGFDSTWMGASVQLTFDGGAGSHSTTIATVTDATHVILTDAVPADLEDIDVYNSTIVIASAATANIVDLSSLSMYKHIDRITVIEDSVNGLCIEMPEKDFRAIKNYAATENDYSDTVIWYRAGQWLYFCKNSLSAYGIRTMFYIRNPYKPTAYTDIVDYPDTQMKMLIDVCVTTILQSLNVQLPQDLQSVAARLQAMRAAVNEERQKAEANYKTQ